MAGRDASACDRGGGGEKEKRPPKRNARRSLWTPLAPRQLCRPRIQVYDDFLPVKMSGLLCIESGVHSISAANFPHHPSGQTIREGFFFTGSGAKGIQGLIECIDRVRHLERRSSDRCSRRLALQLPGSARLQIGKREKFPMNRLRLGAQSFFCQGAVLLLWWTFQGR